MAQHSPLGLSQSEINMWKRCPRQWYVTYYLGFLPADPAPTGARNVGIRLHTALEGHYGYQLDALLVIDLLYKAEIEAHPDDERELRSDWELSRIMLSGYLDWAAETAADANLQVIATEAEVRVPLPGFDGLVDLRAKMDQVVQDTDTGLLSFLDHKSADNFKRHEITELDPQMRMYSLIQMLDAGYPPPLVNQPAYQPMAGIPLVNGGIVNTLRRVKRTKNSKPPYYDRHPFRFSHEQLAATLIGMQQVASEILHARQVLGSQEREVRSLQAVNEAQLTVCRPVPIAGDCDWRCQLSAGLCQLMDQGTSWAEALAGSGRYVQGDPYAYYQRAGAAAIAAAAAAG